MWSVFQVCPITLTTMAFTGKPHAGITADLDPPGQNPLADMDPPSQIWTPYQTFLLSITCIIFGN